MTDTELLNWIQQNHAQVWWTRASQQWTVQVFTGGIVIQPSRPTLRRALRAAREQHWDATAAKAEK